MTERNLGILYADESGRGLTHPFFVLILNAIKDEAESRGYNVAFINAAVDEGDSSFVERCRECHVSGVCLVCVDFESPRVRAVIDSGIPCLTVDHIFKRVPAVLSDNETGVQKLVEYAISRGHSRIALIHGHNNSIVTRTRISQFRNTMAFYNLPVPEEYVKEGLYDDIPLTRKLVMELLKLDERPTCILLPDDMSYFGAQEAASMLGMRIPEDISFAGYDGIPLTQTLRPRLTTILQDCKQIGIAAASQLIESIETVEKPSHRARIFPVELIEGGTIAQL